MKFLEKIRLLIDRHLRSGYQLDPGLEYIGIEVVQNFLNYVGMTIEISVRGSSSRFRGRLQRLSDNYKKLILTDVTEYDGTHTDAPAVNVQDRKLIHVVDVTKVRIIDRRRKV